MNNEPDERFPKSLRLLKQIEFDRVHQGKYYAADQSLVVKAVSNDQQHTRLGLSVSRKVGNAVARNRWKRVIREVFRRQCRTMPSGLDIVVRPRKGATCSFDRITKSLPQLLKRLRRNIDRDQERGPRP